MEVEQNGAGHHAGNDALNDAGNGAVIGSANEAVNEAVNEGDFSLGNREGSALEKRVAPLRAQREWESRGQWEWRLGFLDWILANKCLNLGMRFGEGPITTFPQSHLEKLEVLSEAYHGITFLHATYHPAIAEPVNTYNLTQKHARNTAAQAAQANKPSQNRNHNHNHNNPHNHNQHNHNAHNAHNGGQQNHQNHQKKSQSRH